MSGNFFMNESKSLTSEHDKKEASLGLAEKKSKRKVQFHATLPMETKKRLESKAQEMGVSVSVMLQLLIDKYC